MTTWTEEELSRIGDAHELKLASERADGAMRRDVTMWVVRAGDDVYVRSAYGPDNPWFRRAKSSGAGRIRAGGLEREVHFAEAAPDVHAAIDAAYHAKYDQYGPKIVGTVVGPDAATVTIKLVPARLLPEKSELLLRPVQLSGPASALVPKGKSSSRPDAGFSEEWLAGAEDVLTAVVPYCVEPSLRGHDAT